MADNITVTPGAGATVAADEIGGALYQRMKLGVGADGEAADLDYGQATKAASLPVTLPSDPDPLPIKDAGPSTDGSRQYTTSADMTGAADLTAAPAAGQKIVITDLVVSSAVDMALTLLEETSGTVQMVLRLTANSPVQITPRGKWKLPTADKKLRGDASVAGQVDITVFYYSEA